MSTNLYPNLVPALLLALMWGVGWALFLQFHPHGQYLAVRRTWITVVIGVGVDLLIALLVLDAAAWLRVFGVIVASSIGVIGRSLINEHKDEAEFDLIKDL